MAERPQPLTRKKAALAKDAKAKALLAKHEDRFTLAQQQPSQDAPDPQ